MKFNALALAAALAATAAAQTVPGPFFINSGLDDGAGRTTFLTASNGKIDLGSANAGAHCSDGPTPVGAIFILDDGRLRLFSRENQEVEAVVSDDGQNQVQYTTGNQPSDPPTQRGRWAVGDNENLQFDNKNLWACPFNPTSDYPSPGRIFVGKPEGYDGCKEIKSLTTFVPLPVPCTYSPGY